MMVKAFDVLGAWAGRLGLWALLLATTGNAFGAGMDLEGSFNVTPNGTATYDLPIEVPPGTAGIVPALSLTYASSAGNGLLGVGWSLNGLPSITRCPQTIAQDGAIVGVTFTSTDRFCFGGQRLIPISGAQGGNGTEYRTEIDSFNRIFSYTASGVTGPAYWVVYTKKGQIQEFGNTATSPNAFVQAAGLAQAVARAWAIDKVSDLSGNAYTVNYYQNTTTGEVRPTEIDYTKNTTQGVDAYNSVQFCYTSTRPDTITAYQAGSTITTSVLLSDVLTVIGTGNNACSNASIRRVFDYNIQYQMVGGTGNNQLTGNAGRSRVAKITQINGSGVALPSLVFQWQSSGVMNPTPITATNAPSGYVPYVADFNGDGKDDILWVDSPGTDALLWLSEGAGTFNTSLPTFQIQANSLIYIGDFDGSGRSGILAQGFEPGTNANGEESGPENNCFIVYTSNLNSAGNFVSGNTIFNAGQDISTAITGTSYTNKSCTGSALPNPSVAIGDFDGSGRSSIAVLAVKQADTSSGSYFGFAVGICLNTSTQGQFSCQAEPGYLMTRSGAPPQNGGFNLYVGDFNGDGRADLLIDEVQGSRPALSDGRYRQILLSGPGGSLTPAASTAGLAVANTNIYVGDFNGDGIADVLLDTVDGSGNSTGSRSVMFGHGDGTLLSAVPLTIPDGTNTAMWTTTIAQFTGTGRSDILLTAANGNWVSTAGGAMLLLSNGTGSFAETKLPVSGSNTLQDPNGAFPYVGDFNGVGHDGVFWNYVQNPGNTNLPSQASNGTYLLQQSDLVVPDLLTDITPGLVTAAGVAPTIAIGYQTLAQAGSPYTKSSGSVYPILDVQNTMPVVATVELPDGVDGNGHPYTYDYSGFKTDLSGRGSLGFAQFVEYDLGLQQSANTYFVKTTQFNQVFPLTGLPTQDTTQVYIGSAPTTLALSVHSAFYQSATTTSTVSEMATSLAGASTSVAVPIFAAPGASSMQRWDLNGAALPTTTESLAYDCASSIPCYGNVASSSYVTPVPRSSPPTNYTTTTQNLWCNDTSGSNWLIGLLIQTQVTRTTPSDTTGETRLKTATFDAHCTNGSPINSVPSGHTLSVTLNPTSTDPTQTLVTRYGYDLFGNRTTVDVGGRTSTTSWVDNGDNDASGANRDRFPQSQTDPMGNETQLGYATAFGSPTTIVDPNGLISSIAYDGFGRRSLTAAPDGTGASYTYAYCSSLPSGVAACPATAAYVVTTTPVAVGGDTIHPQLVSQGQIGPLSVAYYDLLGRTVQTDTQGFDGGTSSQTSQVTTVYDADGRLTQTSLPYSAGTAADKIPWTKITPDALGRPLSVTTPDNATIQHQYNGLSQTDTYPTEPGSYGGTEIITTVRNALLQKVSVSDPLGNLTTSTYDDFGNLATVTDPAQHQVQYSYDLRDRRTKVVDPDSGTHTYTYLSTGEVASDSGPAPTGSGTLTVSYASYDLDGRLTERIEPDLLSYWVYDSGSMAKGKLSASCTGANAGSAPAVSTTICTAGSALAPSFARTYAYDSMGRVGGTTLTFGSQSFGFADKYVPAGQNGPGKLQSVTNTGSGAVTTYGYTGLGYLQGLSKTPAAGSSAPVYTITGEDAAFRITTETLGSSSFTNPLATGSPTSVIDTYSYDQLNELREADNGSASNKIYSYDTKTGNITSKSDVGSYTYGASGPHQVSAISGGSAGSVSFSYDGRGRMKTGDGGTSYSWTSFDQPLTVTQGGATVTFAYDTEHRRISATTGVGTTYYLWDDATGGYAELFTATGVTPSASSGSWSDYFSARGSMVGLLRTPPSGSNSSPVMAYFHRDAKGSVVAVSGDNGEVLAGQFYSFDPWGKRRYTNGSDDTSDQLPGQADGVTTRGYIQQEELNGFTNLLNLNARLYNPYIGRFVSPDPAGLTGGSNAYAYAGNNPTTQSDPTGLAPVTWTLGAARLNARLAANTSHERASGGLGGALAALAQGSSPDLSGVPTVGLDNFFSAKAVGSSFVVAELISTYGAQAVETAYADLASSPNSEVAGTQTNGAADPQTQAAPQTAPTTGVGDSGGGARSNASGNGLPIGAGPTNSGAPKQVAQEILLGTPPIEEILPLAEAAGDAAGDGVKPTPGPDAGPTPSPLDGSLRPNPAPGLDDDPWSPRNVDQRRSQWRDVEGAPSRDPDSPIPDRGPGSDQGGHPAKEGTPHDTGERNVNRNEEHSIKPKGNPSGRRFSAPPPVGYPPGDWA